MNGSILHALEALRLAALAALSTLAVATELLKDFAVALDAAVDAAVERLEGDA